MNAGRARSGRSTLLFPYLLAAALAVATGAGAQQALTTPEKFFGHAIGADYQLPNYKQLSGYWSVLDRESDRMRLVEIGTTAEGRTQLMAIVTSPANQARLEHYQDVARRLALAEGVTETEARNLAREGKAVVWIDGGLHASEVLGAQQLMETLWQMVSGNDPETLRILDDVVILFVHANPDGMDLVSDWYMREPEPTKRSTSGVPRLYQKYIGHDNNRDSYASTQRETENMNRVLYREWFPQIMYNHHQTGPLGAVLFAPPFRDPFNYFFDPLVVTGIDLVGSAMHNRFVAEGKGGAVTRTGANYSTWWNGGLRTTVYFHNMIGLLSETIGNPTPSRVPLVLDRLLPTGTQVLPVEPQEWHFRQSVDYSVTANKAVLDVASRYRETFLFNIWRMGMNSIERGSRDHWTVTPKKVAALQAAAGQTGPRTNFAAIPGGLGGMIVPPETLAKLRTPEARDPRGYILPADQADFPTATRFVNALLENGVTVMRATADFTVAGRRYPAGSYVVKADQAFRPHVLDMFEPQDHPNDIPFPGAPPTPPYDVAGWTLAFQMGLQFDRILDGFDGPFERLAEWNVAPPAGAVAGPANPAGYVMSHRVNDAFRVINRLEKSGFEVYWLQEPVSAGGASFDAGAFWIPEKRGVRPALETMAKELGVAFAAIAQKPAGQALQLRPVRIGLWDMYGGSMESGWIRWLLEQWEYPSMQLVFPPRLDAGNLKKDFDVLILPNGALGGNDFIERIRATMPDSVFQALLASFGYAEPDPATLPEEWRARLGSITPETTLPKLREFLEAGGTILTIGSSTRLAEQLGLPVSSHLVETDAQGRTRPLGQAKYYVPGSVLRARVDTKATVATGLTDPVDVFFDNSPVLRLGADAAAKGVKPVAWFDTDVPLRSGWGWGQQYLKDGVAVAEATVGKGKLYLFGPEVAFRAQPHGTFKLLFNGIALATARSRTP